MKSTHNSLLAYGKGVVAAIAIVTGTAVMMSAFSPSRISLRGYSQNKSTQNGAPEAEVSTIERIKGKLNQQAPDATSSLDLRTPDPS